MCKYAMGRYKEHYACFACRKTFKRKLLWDINRDDKRDVPAKCPQCGELMAGMGYDFASPPMNDLKKWAHIQSLYTVGITFHSCGCTGPGYIPNSREKLVQYFLDIRSGYHRQLEFWRQRCEPMSQAEIDREKSKNWDFVGRIPSEVHAKKGTVSAEDARNYWIEKIREVEGKLRMIAGTGL